VSAHQLPPEVVAYFFVDGPQLRVFVRVPTSMLSDARLPVVPPGYLDFPNLDAPLRLVAEEVVRSLDLADAGRALPPPSSLSWRVTPQTDRSFSTAEQAAAHFAAAPQLVDLLYWSEAFIDLQFDLQAPRTIERLTARLNGLGTAEEPGQTRATYLPVSAAPRTYVATGPPRRVDFEPSVVDVLWAHARLAIGQLPADRVLLLFLFCLVIPRRPLAHVVRALAIAWCAHLLMVLVVQLASGPLSLPARLAAAVCAAVTVTGLATMNIVGTRAEAVLVAAGLFGAASGLGLGAILRETAPLAGSHPWLAVGVYESAVVLGSALVVSVARPMVRMAFLLPLAEWVVVVGLSVLPAHEASHVVLDVTSQLAALDLEVGNPALAAAVRYWPVLALALALSALLGAAMMSRRPIAVRGAGPLAEP
jgi:hypothetical protein